MCKGDIDDVRRYMEDHSSSCLVRLSPSSCTSSPTLASSTYTSPMVVSSPSFYTTETNTTEEEEEQLLPIQAYTCQVSENTDQEFQNFGKIDQNVTRYEKSGRKRVCSNCVHLVQSGLNCAEITAVWALGLFTTTTQICQASC